jgi:hypothetical protein
MKRKIRKPRDVEGSGSGSIDDDAQEKIRDHVAALSDREFRIEYNIYQAEYMKRRRAKRKVD